MAECKAAGGTVSKCWEKVNHHVAKKKEQKAQI